MSTTASTFFRTDGIPPLGHVRHHAGLPFSAWSHIQPVKYWQGIPAFDPPSRRRDYEGLADMAERMLATRQRRLADFDAQDLARIAAADEVRLFEILAQHWGALCNRVTAPVTGAPDAALDTAAMRDALDAALRTIAAMAEREGEFSDQLAEQAELVIALRWWAEPALRLRPKSETTTPKSTAAKEGELA